MTPNPIRAILSPLLGTLVAMLLALAGQGLALDLVYRDNRGHSPVGELVQVADGSFYGTTENGGVRNEGTVFRMAPTGEVTTLVSFKGDNGSYPQSGLLQGSDGSFYGTTTGTVFKITADGNLTTLASFTGYHGRRSRLMQGSDGNLYGTTYSAGGSGGDFGCVFKVTPSGVLTTLHSFIGTDGTSPDGLVQDGEGNFYGTTQRGGANNRGTVFKITANGQLTTLISFNGTNGRSPESGLIRGSDGNFYGTTAAGGTNDKGSIFQLTPAGALTTIHSFTGQDGSAPIAKLVEHPDGSFWGTCAVGGAQDAGTVFKVTANGDFSTMTSLATADGWYSRSALVLGLDGSFHGARTGDEEERFGSIFKISTTGVLTTTYRFHATGGAGGGLARGSDGNFYGTTGGGGDHEQGTVFKMTPAGVMTTLLSFTGANGRYPNGALVQSSDGNFYGTTMLGGEHELGTVFKMTPSGVLTTLVSFDGTNGDTPVAGLIRGTDGKFYGTTSCDASDADGTVFSMTPAGVLTTLVTFVGTNGAYPLSALTEGGDGFLYGTTYFGGADDSGTIFKVTKTGTLTTLHSFHGTGGVYPNTPLTKGPDGNFYGTTSARSLDGEYGTIFKMTPAGALTTLVSFDGTNGMEPSSGLAQGSDGSFYGTTRGWGQDGGDGYGTIFKMTEDGGLITLHSFDGKDAADPGSTPVIVGGWIYGRASSNVIWKLSTAASATTPPSLSAVLPSEITATGAKLNGLVNPNGTATTVKFEYGPTPSYGLIANATLSPNNGASARNVSAVVTGLSPLTTYHYRIVAFNTHGTAATSDATFTTNAIGIDPRIPQFITFSPIENQSMADPSVELSASADSDQPVTYTVISGPARLSGSILTLTGVGVVVIRASQAGDGTYAPAAIQQQAFVVTENAVESSGDLSIGLSQPVIRLYNSVRTSTKIRAIRDGWDGPVHLHYSGLPAGVTGSLGFADPTSGYLNAGQSVATLSLIVGSTALPGHWPITINASAGGHTATNTLMLIIKPPKYRASADLAYTNFWDGHPDGRTVWDMTTDYTIEVDYTVSPAVLRISGRRIGATSGPANPSDMNISVSGKITTPYPQIDVTIDIGTTFAKETVRLQGYVSGSSLILQMGVAYVRDQGGGGTLVPATLIGSRIHGAEISAKSSPPGSGSIICSPLPPTNGYAKGTVVTLTAEPNPGAVFKGWSEDVSGTTNPIQVTITEDGYPDKQVTATFAEPGGKPPLISSPLTVSGNANIGQAYQFKTSREVQSLAAIGLPQGLHLNSARRIVGTSTEVGDFNMIIVIQTQEGVSYQVMALSIYPPLATGTYYGLVNADTIAHETSGSLKATVAKTGAFSAAIMFGGKSYSLRGKFTPDGSFTGVIPRKLLEPLAVSLELDSQTGQITGTIEGDAGPAMMVAERAAYHAKTNPAPQAGKYTIVSFPMEASSEENPIPQGNGVGTIVVDKAGKLRMVKTLADGTKVAHASSLSEQGSWPFYVALNKSAGSISGMMSMNDDAISDANGIMHWFKPNLPLAAFYPESFGTTYEFVASRYVAPIKGTRVLPYADATNNAMVTIDGGNLVSAPAPKLVTLTATNKVVPPTGEAFSLTLSLSTGLFSGKFLDPATNKVRTFTGAVLQKSEKGYGLFKGNGEYGWIELGSAE